MQRYTRTAVLLHWLMALLIIFAFAIGLSMTAIEGITPAKLKYYSWHKWIGVTVLGVACLRLLWRLTHKAPAYPDSMPRWQQSAAHGLHGLLYLLIFAVPISGYFYTLATGVPVVYLGLWQLPVLIEKNQELKEILKQVHYVLNMSLLAAVVLHVAAALKHVFIDRDGMFKRMLP
jgi:cytochrome b561